MSVSRWVGHRRELAHRQWTQIWCLPGTAVWLELMAASKLHRLCFTASAVSWYRMSRLRRFAGACLHQGWDLYGNDIRSLTALNAHDCQTHCQKDNSCQFFSYNSNGKRCYLKTSDANQKATGPWHISGPKWCAGLSKAASPAQGATAIASCALSLSPPCLCVGRW